MPKEIKPLVHTINQALDRLERGFRMQREFTADAAHELRTPLSILQARIDTMADKEKAKELSRDIARMKRIVSQLLDIAELEAFTVGPDETADLNAVCGEVAAFVAPLAVAEAKQIIFDAPECPVPVHGNAEVIFRAVRNVAENAIRHTPERTAVTITVSAEGAVSVADEGQGIAPAERVQIFQRFWRKHRSGSTGAGLGLSIVKRIMDAHRGEIGISEPGEAGCVFTLKFRPGTPGAFPGRFGGQRKPGAPAARGAGRRRRAGPVRRNRVLDIRIFGNENVCSGSPAPIMRQPGLSCCGRQQLNNRKQQGKQHVEYLACRCALGFGPRSCGFRKCC